MESQYFELNVVASYGESCRRLAEGMNQVAYLAYDGLVQGWKLMVERGYGKTMPWPEKPKPPLLYEVQTDALGLFRIALTSNRATEIDAQPDIGITPVPGVVEVGEPFPNDSRKFHVGPRDTAPFGAEGFLPDGRRIGKRFTSGPFGNWVWYQIEEA